VVVADGVKMTPHLTYKKVLMADLVEVVDYTRHTVHLVVQETHLLPVPLKDIPVKQLHLVLTQMLVVEVVPVKLEEPMDKDRVEMDLQMFMHMDPQIQ
jgi:hypothetical protein